MKFRNPFEPRNLSPQEQALRDAKKRFKEKTAGLDKHGAGGILFRGIESEYEKEVARIQNGEQMQDTTPEAVVDLPETRKSVTEEAHADNLSGPEAIIDQSKYKTAAASPEAQTLILERAEGPLSACRALVEQAREGLSPRLNRLKEFGKECLKRLERFPFGKVAFSAGLTGAAVLLTGNIAGAAVEGATQVTSRLAQNIAVAVGVGALSTAAGSEKFSKGLEIILSIGGIAAAFALATPLIGFIALGGFALQKGVDFGFSKLIKKKEDLKRGATSNLIFNKLNQDIEHLKKARQYIKMALGVGVGAASLASIDGPSKVEAATTEPLLNVKVDEITTQLEPKVDIVQPSTTPENSEVSQSTGGQDQDLKPTDSKPIVVDKKADAPPAVVNTTTVDKTTIPIAKADTPPATVYSKGDVAFGGQSTSTAEQSQSIDADQATHLNPEGKDYTSAPVIDSSNIRGSMYGDLWEDFQKFIATGREELRQEVDAGYGDFDRQAEHINRIIDQRDTSAPTEITSGMTKDQVFDYLRANFVNDQANREAGVGLVIGSEEQSQQHVDKTIEAFINAVNKAGL